MNTKSLITALALSIITSALAPAQEYDKDTKLKLQPAHALWQQYNPNTAKYAFKSTNKKQAIQWQKRTRTALSNTIGFQNTLKINPKAQLLEKTDKLDYTREKILIQTGMHTAMPVYILLPKKAPAPLPVVITAHGHGYGVKSSVGINKDGTERDKPDGYQKDFAIAICRSGFAVAAPEISCFGERLTDFSHLEKGAPKTCKHTAALASHLGGSVLGMRVMDITRLIDYLETRPDIDTSRLGMMGISGGGMLTFFTTAIDQRIRSCVISGYFCTFEHSILGVSHCPCNFVPGLGQFGEMSDIAALIAPRPILIEAGSRDPIFPIKHVKQSVIHAEKNYKIFTPNPILETDYFEGNHQISGKKAYNFLKRTLSK
ncbi:MAG: alpha/beta hydrolase family protein [Planctomycetota bacterium]|jgi:dienelactone hydrolase